MSYCDMLFRLIKDWPEQDYTICALAARYYIGADSVEDLELLVTGGEWTRSLLTRSALKAILIQKEHYDS